MKKVVLVLGLLFLAGCTGNDWARGFQGMGQGLNNAYQMDYQMRQKNQVVYPNPQQNNSTYWQEANARQQYFDRNMPKPTYSP